MSHCRRRGQGSSRGGGVSIAFRKSAVTLREYKIKKKSYEIVCAKGKIANNTGPLFVFAVYLSTSLKASQYHEFLEIISQAILKVKSEAKYPYLILAGDFDRSDISEAIGDYTDMKVIQSGATRGQATLDLAATNFTEEILFSEVLDQLESSAGTLSDHRIVFSSPLSEELLDEKEKRIHEEESYSKNCLMSGRDPFRR